ncbi:lasso peptide biosynthesis PqqD family chaperone [Streptomyces sp. NPDC053048]|uniref:lasso peptide biosynthesis PqqD family chaperone n=1 Tax=Streptomyces sp. NPDC053048 TaxID=3365694 RepID=UPI0037D323ED
MRLRTDVTACDTGDGMVLLDERTGRYWQLNRTGAIVVHALLDGAGPEQAAAGLTATCPVSGQQAGADVDALLEQLTRAGLVTR